MNILTLKMEAAYVSGMLYPPASLHSIIIMLHFQGNSSQPFHDDSTGKWKERWTTDEVAITISNYL